MNFSPPATEVQHMLGRGPQRVRPRKDCPHFKYGMVVEFTSPPRFAMRIAMRNAVNRRKRFPSDVLHKIKFYAIQIATTIIFLNWLFREVMRELSR